MLRPADRINIFLSELVKERLAGRSIIHDCEGRVFSLPISPTEENYGNA